MDKILDVTLELPARSPDRLGKTAQENLRIVEQAYEDQLAGDNDALFKIMAPDVRFREAPGLPYAIDVTGLEETKRGVAGMLHNWKKQHVRIVDYMAGGDTVIAYIEQSCISHSGKPYNGFVAEIFRFRDGKVYEWHPIYWDTHGVRQAIGEGD